MSDCGICAVEAECHYPFKPCDCVHQRKFWDESRRAEYDRNDVDRDKAATMPDRNQDGIRGASHIEAVSALAGMVEALERQAFEAWASDGGKWPRAIERSGEGYSMMHTHQLWRAWKARAAYHPLCRGVARAGCNYLAPCGGICNKCGHPH